MANTSIELISEPLESHLTEVFISVIEVGRTALEAADGDRMVTCYIGGCIDAECVKIGGCLHGDPPSPN